MRADAGPNGPFCSDPYSSPFLTGNIADNLGVFPKGSSMMSTAVVTADTLFSTLYGDLHRMARRELSKRAPGSTLSATTLLHEAYLDMSGRDAAAFPDRNRFMAYASRVMRGLIIDYMRSRQAQK